MLMKLLLKRLLLLLKMLLLLDKQSFSLALMYICLSHPRSSKLSIFPPGTPPSYISVRYNSAIILTERDLKWSLLLLLWKCWCPWGLACRQVPQHSPETAGPFTWPMCAQASCAVRVSALPGARAPAL